MSDDFLTKGLQNDRYPKARQLVSQFEDEIEIELRTIGERIVEENSEWFDDGVEGSEGGSTKSNSLPYARVDYPMARLQSEGSDTALTLNVHLYWADPSEYNRRDIDGVLRALGYKIKNVPEADEQRVASRTRGCPLRVSENRFGQRKAFYSHVSTAEEVEETGEQLVEHFTKFVGEYGVPRDE